MAQQRASGFERPLRLVSLLWLHLVLSALFVSFPPHHAKAMGVGTLGWCTPLGFGTTGCFPTAAAACEAQWQHYEPTRVFFGYTDGPRWFIKHCQWSVALGVIHPAPVDFRCSPGYERLPSGLCVLATEFYQQRKPPRQKENPTLQRNACNAAGGNINNGGSANPTTPNAIEITSGSKFFSAEDYRTADDSIVLERIYTSLSYGGADFFWKDTLGLGTNWRFSFQHEIHIHWNFEYIPFVQLQTAQGGSFGFRKNGSGGLDPDVPDYGIIQTDYRLEFVGTWPPNSGVLNTVTQWKMRDPDDRVWLFESFYDPANNNYGIAHPISVTFPGGLQWTFTYGPYQELVSIADSYGKSVSFEWLYRDPSSVGALLPPVPTAVSKVTLPDTTTLNYTYDSASGTTVPGLDFADRLLKVEHKDAASNVLDATSYVYGNSDFPWHVTKIQDADGTDRWFVEYDTSGRAIVSRGPDDADKYAVAYGTIASNAFTRTVTNALGKQTVYNFAHGFQNVRLDSIAGVASANCPASTQTFAYQSGFIRTVTDAEGRATRFSRNTAGQPTTIIDGWGTASARTTTLTWHTTFRVPTQIAQPLLTTDLTWNASRQLTQVTQTDTTTHSVPYSTNGQTRTWSYSYDTFGRLLTVDGPLAGSGDTVTYTYDSDGFLASITNEVGHVLTVSTVDANGYPTSVVDENGVTIGLTYDSERRLKTVTVDPGGANAVTTLDYDVVGQITRITRPNGAFLEYTWDDGKRLTKVEDNTGGSIEYDRNDFGNITARRVKNAGGTILLSQTATFDELGRLLTFVGAASQTWTSAYDKTDRLVSVTDPRSNIYQWAYDSLIRLIRETDEENAQINLTLNGKDEVTNYRDPRSLDTGYVRNGFGEVIQRSSPDTGTTVYEYNALGKVTKITDARGVVTNLTYDNAGRLLTKQYPGATAENITVTWDSTASGNKGVGRITKIQDASGSVEWTYNALGQTTSEKKTTATRVYTVGYAYDLDGNVTEMTYPSGRIVTYARDSVGRISGVTTKKDAGSAVVPLASSVAYLPFGPVTSFTYGNNLVLTRGFTQDYLIDTLKVEDTSTTVLDRDYDFGDDINLTDIADSLTPARTESYAYSDTNRLEDASGTWGALIWDYDGVGNRTLEALTSGSTTTWTYAYPSSNNRLSTVTEGANVRTFTHDAAGNITADARSGATYNYRYNARGRLDRLTIGTTVTADYVYDGLERLAVRTTQNMVPAGTTHYVYDLAGRLIAEADDTGQTLREYIWLDDMPLAVVADVNTVSPQLWFVHADHLNRPIKMTDGAQAVVWDAVYRPFGEVVSITGSASNNLRFPGQYFLIESGLHYNWHRHYEPTTGRYLQADPLEFVDGPNLYAYARSSPQIYVDEEGQFSFLLRPVVGALVGFSVDVAIQYASGKCVDFRLAVVRGGLIGASLGLSGPAGPIFGRAKLRGGSAGLLNRGDFRIGWSWNQSGWAGRRNYFGTHGGSPRTPSHWHRTPIPGPKGRWW